MEEWRPVRGYEDTYQVSSLGRVRSVDRIVRQICKHGGMMGRRMPGRLLTGAVADGYRRVVLRRAGERKRVISVHILVAEAFLGPRPSGATVCHNNGVRADNRAANLRYDTQQGNLADRKRHGTHPAGERNGNAVLTEADVRDIRKLAGAVRQKDLSARFGVCPAQISHIVTGRSWPHV